jgi:putative membrane protein
MTDRLANERTFLAYLRTALSCIGFGFVVARFGLFVRELTAQTGMSEPSPISAPLGVVLICAGIVVAVFGGYRYIAVERAIAQGRQSGLSIGAALAAVAVLCVLGIIVAIVIFRT